MRRADLAILIFLPACTGGAGANHADKPGEGGDSGPAGAPVEIVHALHGAVSDGIPATATVSARTEVTLTTQTGGTVAALAVEEGDAVNAGQRLARIDDPVRATLIGKAASVARKAEQDLATARRLSKQGLVPRQQLDEAEFNERQAALELKRLREEESRGRVVSPIDGVVVTRHLELGEPVALGQPAFVVADLSALEVDLRVPERHLARLAAGMAVEITAEGIGETAARGKVARISPTVDPRTGTVKVTVDLGDGRLDGGRLLRPGMYVRAQIIVDRKADAVLIPKRAIVYEDDRPVAYRVRDGRAQKLSLRLGYTSRTHVEVGEPIGPGDAVVVFGQNGLKDGASVRVVRQESAADAGG